jgi:hypothetical protein
MGDNKQINDRPLQPMKSGNSWCFRIKPSKIVEKVIDSSKMYHVFAKEVQHGKNNQKTVD